MLAAVAGSRWVHTHLLQLLSVVLEVVLQLFYAVRLLSHI